MLSTGIDIVKNSRFDNISDRLRDHLFTDYEIENSNGKSEYYASRFASKEAFVKALGTGFIKNITPKCIEVRKNSNNQPYLVLTKDILDMIGSREVSLSISHEKEYSVAMVVISWVERIGEDRP